MHNGFVYAAACIGTVVDFVRKIGSKSRGIAIGFAITAAVFVRAVENLFVQSLIAVPVVVEGCLELFKLELFLIVNKFFDCHDRIDKCCETAVNQGGIVEFYAVLIGICAFFKCGQNGGGVHVGRVDGA